MKSFIALILISLIFTLNSCEPKVNNIYEEVSNQYAEFFKINDNELVIYSEDKSDSIQFLKKDIQSKRIALQSTTQIEFLQNLNALEKIKAVPYANYLCNDHVINGIATKDIDVIGSGQNMSIEPILVHSIDLLLLSDYIELKGAKVNKLQDKGIKCIPIMDWKEAHPLGRTEWIKVIAWLVGEYDQGVNVFNNIERNYLTIKDSIVNQIAYKERPKVISGAPYKDNWFIPGGKSYMAHLINDAGGTYVFNENKERASFQMAYELVHFYMRTCDKWVCSTNARYLDVFTEGEEKLSRVPLVEKKEVYGNSRQICASGGNLFWSHGIMHPDRVLKDLFEIFYGDDRKAFYYQQLR